MIQLEGEFAQALGCLPAVEYEGCVRLKCSRSDWMSDDVDVLLFGPPPQLLAGIRPGGERATPAVSDGVTDEHPLARAPACDWRALFLN